MRENSSSRDVLIVGLHFVLACAISWSLVWGLGVSIADDGWGTLLSNPLLIVVKFGPTFAGLIVIAIFGPPGGWRLFRNRLFELGGPLGLFGAVLVAALATLPAALGVAVALDMGVPIPTATILGAAVSWIGLRTFFGGGLGEEIGWRGVVLPVLLGRMGPRNASFVLGVLWTLWHLPALFGSDGPWWLLMIAQGVLTVSLSFVFTWVWLRTGGSLPVAILFHGALNGFNEWAETSWIPALDDVGEWQIVRILLLLVLGIVAAIALPGSGEDPHSGRN